MAGYLLTGNSSKYFVHVEVPSPSLQECQLYLSLLCTRKEKCFDEKPFYCQDTTYYVDPISRQIK